MLLPNKVICYNKSVISKFPIVLSVLEVNSCYINELYFELKNCFVDINEYIDVLDSLFALGKIDIENNTRRLYYVK